MNNKKTKNFRKRARKTLTKKEKQQTILLGKEKIVELSKKLNKHTERNLNINHINYKLFYLLHDPFTFVKAYTKISKNKGALTKGREGEGIMEYFGLEAAKLIADQIKEGKYKFKSIKRIWIPKPGKKSKRPVDVFTQSDRIVQAAVRGILEAIYEPVFQEHGRKTNNLSNNYGFRPKMSTWIAVDMLHKKSKRCNMTIEGDIVSAYKNVNHNILLGLLKLRIRDNKFLHFIRFMLKSGIMDNNIFEHSLDGTSRGGIVSPLLFNIYMFGLDEYVYEEIIKPLFEKNKEKMSRKFSKLYEEARRKNIRALRILKETKQKEPNNRTLIKLLTKNFKNTRAYRNRVFSVDIENQIKGAVYVRYADDWVLSLTCNQKEAEIIKGKISNYLKTQRKMELDEKKTKITRISKGYKFLGYEIRLNTTKSKLSRVLRKDINGKYSRPLRRTISRLITVKPDSEKILKRLIAHKFCDKSGYPKGKAAWTVYDEFQIVQKYSQILRGIFVYYLPSGRLFRLTRASYILHYSCAKTLAKRKKVSLRNIFKIYTKKLMIKHVVKGTNEKKTRIVSFDELTDLKKKQKIMTSIPVPSDPFRIQ